MKHIQLGILALLAAVVISVATAAPVAAAGSATKQDIYACFVWSGTTYSRQPVYLYVWSPTQNKWMKQRDGTTNASGCAQYNDLAVGRQYAMQAYKSFFYENGTYWTGSTTATGVTQANDRLWNLGTIQLFGYYF